MTPTSATTIADVTALGPINGLRGLGTFRPDPTYGPLGSFRPDPTYGALSSFRPDSTYGFSGLVRYKNKFPYGFAGIGQYDGQSATPVLIGLGVLAAGVGLAVWFWTNVFKLAREKL